jgi:hypothetical protein
VALPGRSTFLTEIAREEIQRRNQREALKTATGVWKDEDHPELRDGSAGWVRGIRAESGEKFQRIGDQRDRG